MAPPSASTWKSVHGPSQMSSLTPSQKSSSYDSAFLGLLIALIRFMVSVNLSVLKIRHLAAPPYMLATPNAKMPNACLTVASRRVLRDSRQCELQQKQRCNRFPTDLE